jgi:hypothetical protein
MRRSYDGFPLVPHGMMMDAASVRLTVVHYATKIVFLQSFPHRHRNGVAPCGVGVYFLQSSTAVERWEGD